VGNGDDNFECTFPPASETLGWCPSHKLKTTQGEVYTVFMKAGVECRHDEGVVSEYQLYVKANGDPSLTFQNEGDAMPATANVSAQGSVTIVEQ
jgi:hypothetical protein